MENHADINDYNEVRKKFGMEPIDKYSESVANVSFKTPTIEKQYSSINPSLSQAASSFSYPSTITSAGRDPNENAIVGGVPHSRHLTNNALDFRKDEFNNERKQYFKDQGFHVVDEPDHLHVETTDNEVTPSKPYQQSPEEKEMQDQLAIKFGFKKPEPITPAIDPIAGTEAVKSSVGGFFKSLYKTGGDIGPRAHALNKIAEAPLVPEKAANPLGEIVTNAAFPPKALYDKLAGKSEVEQGIEQSVGKNLVGLTSPKSLLTGAGLTTPLAPILLAAMTPGMVKGTYQSGKQAYKSLLAGQPKETAEATTDTLLNALMTVGGVKGAMKGFKAPEATIPEASETLKAQVDSLKQGNSKAVLVTPGEKIPAVPKSMKTLDTDVGTFIYDPLKVKGSQILQSVEEGTHGKLLGYVEPKSPETTENVAAFDTEGKELKGAQVSPEKIPEQIEELKKQFPESEIKVGGPEQTLDLLNRRIENATKEGIKPEGNLPEHKGIGEERTPTETGSGNRLLGGGEIPEEIGQETIPPAPVRQSLGEPVYLGSGLGGLQQLFEKSPEVVARENALSKIEAHAKNTGKKLTEAMDDLGMKFDPELYSDVLQKQREIAGKSTKQAAFEKTKEFYKSAKSKLVDFNAPIEDLIRDAQKKGKYEILPKYDYSNQVDRVLRAPTLAGQFAKDMGLESLIKEVDNLNNFDQYLIAKRAKEVEAKGIKTGRDLVKDESLVQAFAPKYEKFAQRVSAYSHRLLDYSVDSGLISKELSDSLKKEYPNYVPLNRVFSEIEKGGQFNPKGVASLSKQTVVQMLEGSEREIHSPIESLLAKTHDAFIQGEKNKAARTLASFKELPGFEGLIKELPKGETAKHTFSYLENGEKKTFETTKDIEAAAKSLNVQQLNILGKIFALPVRLAKTGITGLNIPFTASNIIRDQFTAFVNTGNPMATLPFSKAFFKGFLDAIRHGELYQELVREGAGGTSFDIAREQAPLTIQRIRSGRGLKEKALYTVKHPSELLRAVENIIGRGEEVTRLQQYEGTRRALLKQGRTPEDAKILAAKAARENTANFYRRGEWGTVINSAFLYLNASKEGTRAFLRGAKRSPLQTAAKVGMAVMFPQLVSTMWNLSDPERRKAYEDIYPYIKDTNLLYIPPNPTQDEKGRWNIIKIPLEPGIGKLAIPIRRLVEQMYGLDPLKASEVAKATFAAFSPVDADVNSLISTFTPQALKPSIEAFTNKNLFTGAPQVPPRLQNLSPERQVKPTTSGTARKIGEALGVSPIKVEEFIKETAGGVGGQTLNTIDKFLAASGAIPKEQIGGQSVLEGIMSRFTKAPGGKTERDVFEAIRKYKQKGQDVNDEIRQQAQQIINNFPLYSEEKKQQIRDDLKENKPEVYQKIKEMIREKEKGLSPTDYAIKSLGVKDGSRANYIYDQIKKMKTSEEKQSYYNDLKNKKIITKEVRSQLVTLLKNKTT